MDSHVQRMANVLQEAREAVEGELYESPTFDAGERIVGKFPALKARISNRTVNVVLCDVPGNNDHFSIVVKAWPRFTLHVRKEARFDWVAKSLSGLEDHKVGVADFDRDYLIGGCPKSDVMQFFQQEEVRGWVRELGAFENLAAGTGFVRAIFPLTPTTDYGVEDLRVLVVSMLRLAEAAEKIAVEEDGF